MQIDGCLTAMQAAVLLMYAKKRFYVHLLPHACIV
jgi:hypothetical protein